MNSLGFFLRGLLMGLSDIIPGISGGTIALITGIYERLINAFSHVITFKKEFFRYLIGRSSAKKLQRLWSQLDMRFLSLVLLGIVLAVFAGAHALSYVLTYYELYTLAVLVGLIFVSALLLLKQQRRITWMVYLGVVFGAGISLFSPLVIAAPATWYLVFGGALAISAMLLPGISGSFVLLILGLYDVVLAAVKLFDWTTLLPFFLGILLGAIAAVRLISWLFVTHHQKTRQLLIGFVLGALLVPLRRILTAYNGESIFVLVLLALAAGILILLVER